MKTHQKAARKTGVKTSSVSPEEALKRFVAWLKGKDTGVTPHRGYSGRFVSGKKCFGVVGHMASIQGAFLDFIDDHPECSGVIRELVRSQRIDDMAKEKIIYFPDVDIDATDKGADCEKE